MDNEVSAVSTENQRRLHDFHFDDLRPAHVRTISSSPKKPSTGITLNGLGAPDGGSAAQRQSSEQEPCDRGKLTLRQDNLEPVPLYPSDSTQSYISSSNNAQISRVRSLDLNSTMHAPLRTRVQAVHLGNNLDTTSSASHDITMEPRTNGSSAADLRIKSPNDHSSTTSTFSPQLPDLLGRETFQLTLHHPDATHQLLRFCQSHFCGENMEFLEKVNRYHTLLAATTRTISEIHQNHIVVGAPGQINIAQRLRSSTNKDLELALTSILPQLESIFGRAQDDIEALIEQSVYPRFVRHQMSISATKALAGNRCKYAGLGDCFVLTSPLRADNPIVYASDGFVNVTGYTRQEIIPRNCRFLQGQHTDQTAVKRVKESLDQRKESVELLVNYRKTQEPFWNLLYTAPLYDVNGNLVFFLGGQINLSTTVKNASEVVRILSTAKDAGDPTEHEVKRDAVIKESRTVSILKSLKSNWKQPIASSEMGMEQGLLHEMGNLDVEKQMDAFYSAYSKYLVVNYPSFLIAFSSTEVASFFYPPKLKLSTQLIGIDIFRFFKDHSLPDSMKGFKERVKDALRSSRSISLKVTLGTRRCMGFEKFATHWTPLKDEHGKVEFVIITIGSNKL